MGKNELLIENIKLDFSSYYGKDLYSDGDIENEILEIVKKASDYDNYINESNHFEIFYHLSKEREMIVEPMDISSNDVVLEVGSGCGAITGALAQKAKFVECIELSKRRSMINAYKNKLHNNVIIHVGNYQDIEISQKYDVITLIGVLEYAGYYIQGENPHLELLQDIRTKLKTDGKLYVAIENRLGIKYLSGCKEDHFGKEFVGVEGYPMKQGIRTFSYYELIHLFKQAGFSSFHFFYPYPDYKFPHAIYSDAYLPQKGELKERGTNYTFQRVQTFDEISALNSLQMENEFKIFSNSFLVELRN